MKAKSTSIAAIAAAVVCIASVAPSGAQNYTEQQIAAQQQTFREAEAAAASGDFATAEAKARSLQRLRPGDPHVRNLLIRIARDKTAAAARSPWEGLLGGVSMSVDFDETTLEEVVDLVKRRAKEQSGRAPAFVFRKAELRDRLVSLKLDGVPLTAVLKYAGDLASVDFRYEKYAIMVTDRAEVAAPRTAPAREPAAEGLEAVPGLQSPVLLRPNDDRFSQ